MFTINDTVEVIDDAIIGTVIAVNGNTFTIEDAFGFRMEYEDHQLILSPKNKTIERAVNSTDINSIVKQKEVPKRKKTKTVKPKQRNAPTFEVDLHIHKLKESTKGMTNFDMLNLQLDTVRQQLDFAIKKRIPKLVFIHGVGQGVLKQELDTILRRYNNINFYDADFKTYGYGATEVKIFQNLEP